MKEEINNSEPDNLYNGALKKDRSLLYMGIGLGTVILVMGYLTFFVEEPQKLFNKEVETETVAEGIENKPQLLEENSGMSDADVRTSLVKFVEAFHYDQRKGYFDPPSYFASITQTYYNYHNLTHKRLREIHYKLLQDKESLNQNWIVSSLKFERQGRQLLVNYWVKIDYFKPSTGMQESAHVKNEMIIDEEGKILSLREVEVKNFSSYVVVREPDSMEVNETGATPPETQTNAPAPAETPEAVYEGKLHDMGTVDVSPEYYGGPEVLNQYLSSKLTYPASARRKRIEGRVYISFVVEKNGTLSDHKIEKGIGGGCDEEALRVLQGCPAWKPGYVAGKAVRTSYTLPVSFKLYR